MSATLVEVTNGALTVISGHTGGAARLVKIKIPCDLNTSPDHGVPAALFTNRRDSISATFPNALRIEVQLDFKFDDTTSSSVVVPQLGDWVRKMVNSILGLKFAFPCETYVAVTDAVRMYSDSNDHLVALGDSSDGSDDPVLVIMGNRGCLVQIGQTGY